MKLCELLPSGELAGLNLCNARRSELGCLAVKSERLAPNREGLTFDSRVPSARRFFEGSAQTQLHREALPRFLQD